MTLELEIDNGPFKRTYQKSASTTVVTPTSKYADLFKIYEQVLALPKNFHFSHNQYLEFSKLRHKIKCALDPSDIQLFLSSTTPYEAQHHYRWATGFLINRLLENSHYSNIDTFRLDLRSLKPIDNLFRSLEERANGTLRIMVDGSCGDYTNSCSKGGTYYIDRTGGVGLDCESGTFYLRSANPNCGRMFSHMNVTTCDLDLSAQLGKIHVTCLFTPQFNFDQLWLEAEEQYFGGLR